MESSENEIRDLLRAIPEEEENIFDLKKELSEDGKDETRLVVSNRKLLPEEPKLMPRMESPARCHQFHSIDGFLRYLEKRGGDNTLVLADIEQREMMAILDEEKIGGVETVSYHPPLHPLYEPWSDMNYFNKGNDGIALSKLVDFLMVNRRVVISPEPQSLIMTLSQVRASKNVELIKGRGLKCVNSLRVELEIQGEVGGEPAELPDCIKISVPLFVNNDEVVLTFDLLLFEKNGDIYAKLTTCDDEVKMIQVFQEMIDQIGALDKGTVALGEVNFVPWHYLKENPM